MALKDAVAAVSRWICAARGVASNGSSRRKDFVMDAAALVLLVAGIGVDFGWQPMPDGTPRYEYVVQVEPEMVTALASGQSIPLVSDVPDDVRPIGRIRVVVGHGAPPRQRLVTRLKPVGDSAPGANRGVELAQYTGAAGAFDPATHLPPATNPPVATAWNDSQPLNRVGEEIRNAAAPLRRGINGLGNRVQEAADNLGDRTQEILGELRTPFRRDSTMSGGLQLPAAATNSHLGAEGQTWNSSGAASGPMSAPRLLAAD
jgi:hypothetical protein